MKVLLSYLMLLVTAVFPYYYIETTAHCLCITRQRKYFGTTAADTKSKAKKKKKKERTFVVKQEVHQFVQIVTDWYSPIISSDVSIWKCFSAFFSFVFLAENNTYEDVWLILEIVSIHSLSSRVCSSSTVYTALKTDIQSGPEVFGQRFNFASAHNQIIF